jgi:hypothetical protein
VPVKASADLTAVRNHYVSHLGAPEDVVELSGNVDPSAPLAKLEIACFAPSGLGSPVLYATCGISRVESSDKRRYEAMAIIRPQPPKDAALALMKILGRVGLHVASGAAIGRGAVLRDVEGLDALTALETLIVLPPLTMPLSFHRMKRADGEVEILWLVPISESEARYREERGPEALLERFALARADLSSWRRPPVDLSAAPAPKPEPRAPTPAPVPKSAEKQAKIAALKADALARAARAEERKERLAKAQKGERPKEGG